MNSPLYLRASKITEARTDVAALSVADAVAASLHAHGVRAAFGMPGGEVVALVDALQRVGIRFVLTRHETPAAIAAAGFCLSSPSAPGLLVTTLGPGLANAVNGIADAVQERVPLIVLSGAADRPIRGRYTHQVTDHAALLQQVVKGSFEIDQVGAAETVSRAVRLAMAPPMGPVHLDLSPALARLSTPEGTTLVRPTLRSIAVCNPRDPALTELREQLQGATRPLIIAGFEAARSGAAAPLRALADRGIPVTTTYKAKGVVDETHPSSLGAAGLSPKADALLLPIAQAADLVLLAGYDPIEMRQGWLEPFAPSASVIELSGATVDHGMHRVDRQIVGELPSLLSALVPDRPERRPGFWPRGEIQKTREALNWAFARPVGASWGPHAVVETLQAVLPEDAFVTVDSGAHRILLSQKWRARQPLSLLQSAGWCTMGAALPLAFGAKLGQPMRPVVAVMGDGGIEMVLGELGTLRDEKVPVVLVVFQDASLALIELKQRQAGFSKAGVGLGRTDLAAVAKAFGGAGVTVSDTQGLRAALESALCRSDAFTLIACALGADGYVGQI